MATDPKIDTSQRSVLEFKSSTLTVPVLVLAENDLTAIETQLTIKIQQAPEFFKNSPLIIDLNKISTKNLEIDLAGIIEVTRKLDLQAIGIRGGNETINHQAQELNIALLAEERKHQAKAPPLEKIFQKEAEQKQDSQQKQQSATGNTEIISHPIRSGQRIYAAGDLVILAAVSAGAEVMAEGNIHIYGVLRGKALAGVQGNEDSRIFCSNLQAELISIAGNYQVSDNINDAERGKTVQIRLDKKKLIVNTL